MKNRRVASAVRRFGRGASLAVALAVVAAPPVRAQARAFPLLGTWGAGILVADPVGELAEVIGVGWGLTGYVRGPGDGPLTLRLDLGFVEYGRLTQRVCLSLTVGCRIEVDLVTSNNIFFGSLGPHFGVTRGFLRPYLSAGIGFAYFWTESRVEDVDNVGGGEFSTNNFSDGTLALTGVGGFTLQITDGRTPVALDFAARFHLNGEAEYLTEDDIVDNPDGSISVFPNRSEANLLTFQIGVSVGIPGGPG